MVPVGKFRRSESFPAPRPAGSRASAAKSSFRARCISLPSRSHPLAAHLADDLLSLRSWLHSHSDPSLWLSEGLTRLHTLLSGLADVLQLPQAQDPFRRRRRRSPTLADRLLDDFLCLADAHGSFRSVALALRQHLAAAQVALRGRDEPRLASCLRAQRRAGKELAELAAAVREVRKRPLLTSSPGAGAVTDAEEAEVARVMGNVAAVAAEASAAVFLGIAEMSAAAASATEVAPSRFSWAASVLRWRARAASKLPNKKASPQEKKKDVEAGEVEDEEKWRRAALERLRAAEDGVASLESGGEMVFRSLVNVRVTLLNILTPGF